jgi:hypothetical protein
MLAAATGRPVEPIKRSATGTSIGAALLARMERHVAHDAAVVEGDPAAAAYAERWRRAVGA